VNIAIGVLQLIFLTLGIVSLGVVLRSEWRRKHREKQMDRLDEELHASIREAAEKAMRWTTSCPRCGVSPPPREERQ
jgi:hypothetical protein